MDELHGKYARLKEILSERRRVAVAYSSGVDSTLLLWAAVEALGPENTLALTVADEAFPARERAEAEDFCRARGIRQRVVAYHPLEEVEGFRENPANRCYLCKRGLFGRLEEVARAEGFDSLAEGSNVDDEGDYRPGMRAVAELGVLSPLREARLTKAEIRELSREKALPTWDKPSYACLASRFVYGETITREKLARVERAEQYLMDLGFRQVRVRIHGNLARVELPAEDIPRFMAMDAGRTVHGALRGMGFDYVTLDLGGYRTGSMNLGVEAR